MKTPQNLPKLTRIDLSPTVVQRLRVAAARYNLTLTATVNVAIGQYLNTEKIPMPTPPPRRGYYAIKADIQNEKDPERLRLLEEELLAFRIKNGEIIEFHDPVPKPIAALDPAAFSDWTDDDTNLVDDLT